MSIELKEFKDKMGKSLDSLASEYTTIRAGRANPHVLDKIMVEYYGTPTNLQQVANISVSEARTIVIQPWEASLIKEIEKAILTSDLGLTPNNDGKVIRLTFPELTEDRRKELVKDVKKKGEGAKVAIRNIRRDANDMIKKQLKASEISEDEQKGAEDDIQKLTDEFIAKVDNMVDEKSKEIMTVKYFCLYVNKRDRQIMSVPIISQEMENKDGRKKSSKACCNNSRWQWKMGKKAYASEKCRPCRRQ